MILSGGPIGHRRALASYPPHKRRRPRIPNTETHEHNQLSRFQAAVMLGKLQCNWYGGGNRVPHWLITIGNFSWGIFNFFRRWSSMY